VTDGLDPSLAEARRDLAAARYLLDGGFTDPAVSRAYYAAFAAAEEALLAVGEARSKHSGVISAFGLHAVRVGGFDPTVARIVGRLFRLRNEADYGTEDLDRHTAGQAVADAERFVEAVAAWIQSRQR
jgi:uncharacterized protein (UPF0332 family)